MNTFGLKTRGINTLGLILGVIFLPLQLMRGDRISGAEKATRGISSTNLNRSIMGRGKRSRGKFRRL